MFKLLKKYSPEDTKQRKARLVSEAKLRAESNRPPISEKEVKNAKPFHLKFGLNHVTKLIEEKKAKEKVPKWKAESLQLRVGIKQAAGDYVPSREEKQMMEANKASTTVKCPYCGRSFN